MVGRRKRVVADRFRTAASVNRWAGRRRDRMTSGRSSHLFWIPNAAVSISSPASVAIESQTGKSQWLLVAASCDLEFVETRRLETLHATGRRSIRARGAE